MAQGIVDIQDFQRLDLRVGTVVLVERVPNTKKLYRVKVDLGDLGVRQTISGLVGYYEAEQLLHKKIVFLSNLKPIKLAGEDSQGMLLAAQKGEKLALVTVDREVPNGATIS